MGVLAPAHDQHCVLCELDAEREQIAVENDTQYLVQCSLSESGPQSPVAPLPQSGKHSTVYI